MLQSVDRTIKGVTYRVTQLPWAKSRAVFTRLARLLGPALGDAAAHLKLSDVDENGGFDNIKLETVGALLTRLTSSLTDEDLAYLTDVFSESTMIVDGPNAKPLKQEMLFHFAGDITRVFSWLLFCIEVNYTDFLLESGGVEGALRMMKMRQKQRPPTISTSQFTE